MGANAHAQSILQMQNNQTHTAVVDGKNHQLVRIDGNPVVDGKIQGGLFDGKAPEQVYIPRNRLNVIPLLPTLSEQELIATKLDTFDFHSHLSKERDNGILLLDGKERLAGTTLIVGKFETASEIQSRIGFRG